MKRVTLYNTNSLCKQIIKNWENWIDMIPEDEDKESLIAFAQKEIKEMKRVIKDNNKVKTIKSILKKGVNNDKIIAYRRHNSELEEYAFLRRAENGKGFVSLVGGSNYSPCFVKPTYKECLEYAATHRKLYIFKNLQEFLDNKHKMEM